MTLPDAIPAKNSQNFAHKAMKALGFLNLNFLSKPHPPETVSPYTDLPGFTDEIHTSLPAPAFPARPGTPGHLEISVEDWDILFHSIQLRLIEAVGNRLESAPPPQANDTAGHIQVVVLECVSAMAQLHTALLNERK